MELVPRAEKHGTGASGPPFYNLSIPAIDWEPYRGWSCKKLTAFFNDVSTAVQCSCDRVDSPRIAVYCTAFLSPS